MQDLQMRGLFRRLPLLGGLVLTVTLAVLAGCAQKPPPPPPPPPVVVIPPKPTPPMGAPENMTVPPVNANGTRQTVNSGISTPQAVWNLRSAYNVAALNCIEPQYAPILDGYKRFLTVYAKQLASANKEIDRSFRTQHAGVEAIRARETYQTQVYNFFSLPPVDSGFCQAAMEVSVELQTVDASQFENYAFSGLAKMEAPFKSFFDVYEQYKADLAAWQSRYGGGLITVRPSVEQQAEIGTQATQPPSAPTPQPALPQAQVQSPTASAPQPASAPTPAPSLTLPQTEVQTPAVSAPPPASAPTPQPAPSLTLPQTQVQTPAATAPQPAAPAPVLVLPPVQPQTPPLTVPQTPPQTPVITLPQ